MTTPERAGVELTHLDEPLFDGAGATKGDLVDYLDAVAGLILPELQDRPLSVIRARAGQQPFMQKNVPSYAPPWVRTVTQWADSAKREVRYALCDDRRTLLWFANQRAVEYHPTLFLASRTDRPTYLVLDIDPPSGGEFGHAVAAAHLVRQALADAGLDSAVKTSGAKGVHVYVPVEASGDDAAAATRAIAVRAERLDPALATTAFIKSDREGKVFLDSSARRYRGRRVQPAGQAGRAGLVPGAVGGTGWRPAGRLHRAHRAAPGGRAAAVGRPAAWTAGPQPGSGGRGPRDPDRAGPGDARGQAAGAGPARGLGVTRPGAR